MTTQIIVLCLLVLAFASGWVARGPRRDTAADVPQPDPPTEGATAVDAQPPAVREAPDSASLVDDAVADLTAAIDAWMDDDDAVAALAHFETTTRRLHSASADTGDPVLVEVATALADAEEFLAPVRSGAPLTATASARLDAIEQRLADAARRVQRT